MTQTTIDLRAEMLSRWPQMTPEMMEEILWLTPYPAGTVSQILTSLDEAKKNYGDNPATVIKMMYNQIDEEFRAFKEKQAAGEI
jgi:hypothetical protein